MLCADKPIIVSEELGAASVIKKNNLGIVTQNYENALIDVYEKKKTFDMQAKNAAKFVKENLGWDKFADKMISAFWFSLRN